MSAATENDEIATRLEAAARLLADQDANPYRVRAYQRAATGRLPVLDRLRGESDALEILDVDAEYRREAAAGRLRLIAPRRFNPGRKAWLPVLHAQRGARHYTALFSNTARAHEAHRTGDWVVMYFDGSTGERQCTVVTATRGPLQGLRIVRGREDECLHHYRDGGRD